MQRDRLPGWRDLDDKWMFPRSVLQQYADSNDAELIISPIFPVHYASPYSNQLRNMLRDSAGLNPEDLAIMPSWAWDTIGYYDAEAFSPELRGWSSLRIFRHRHRRLWKQLSHPTYKAGYEPLRKVV